MTFLFFAFILYFYLYFDIIISGEFMKKIITFGTISVILDQLIKFFINQNMHINESIKVIDHFFSITYVRNNGAAFSIFSGNRFFLIMISILAIIFIYYTFIHKRKINTIDASIYGLLFGGIIGNLIDRIINGYVIDYLDFKIFNYDFPIFNLADICIVISIILILITTIRRNNNGENNCR